jgi:DNA-binding LacI/PurR family transcriptional regulator
MATIKDIAALSGVGIGTVSRVLNGGVNVSRKTLKKVMDAVRELNYQPNHAARTLARGNYSRTTIGVVLPVIAHPFYFEIIKGLYEALTEENYNLLLFNTGNERRTVFEHIVQEGLAGILFIAEPLSAEEKQSLELNRSRYLYIDYFDETENCVYTDNRAGGALAAQYMLGKKLSRIAYVGDITPGQQQSERLAGFRDELLKNGVSLVCEKYVNVDEEKSYQLSRKLMEEQPSLEGIFYFCDELAYGGLRARKVLGGGVNIVGFDDLLASGYLGLTTIRQPAYRMGFEGAKSILSLIQTDVPEKNRLCLPPELVIRNS